MRPLATIVYTGLTWYCHAAGSAPPATTGTTTTATTTTGATPTGTTTGATTTTTGTTRPPGTGPGTTTTTTTTTTTGATPGSPPCHYHHARELPDRSCTPGASFARVTAHQVCAPGYSQRVRHVTETTKRRVYARYGITTHARGDYEVDHLVPLELGGSNSINNLWPEPAETSHDEGFHLKDRLENLLHARVCSGAMKLRTAQHAMRTNWILAASRYGVF